VTPNPAPRLQIQRTAGSLRGFASRANPLTSEDMRNKSTAQRLVSNVLQGAATVLI